LQREKITAIYNHHGEAYIGKINFHADKHKNLSADAVLTKYSGEIIYNFDAAFVLPSEDVELAEMIVKWNKNPILSNLKAIMGKIDATGGLILLWS